MIQPSGPDPSLSGERPWHWHIGTCVHENAEPSCSRYMQTTCTESQKPMAMGLGPRLADSAVGARAVFLLVYSTSSTYSCGMRAAVPSCVRISVEQVCRIQLCVRVSVDIKCRIMCTNCVCTVSTGCKADQLYSCTLYITKPPAPARQTDHHRPFRISSASNMLAAIF